MLYKGQLFQSPIYGSRTTIRQENDLFLFAFQSPIYGSRTVLARWIYAGQVGFNPLSTGHAPSHQMPTWSLGGVSIPYLRVTHAHVFLTPLRWLFVSIPYLRVTHD